MDDIELAPKRQSFKQGCQVKAQTTGPGERFPADKTRRLTGRASNQRRNFERESDSISAASHDFERMRKNLDFQSRDRSYSNDRHDKYSKHVSLIFILAGHLKNYWFCCLTLGYWQKHSASGLFCA